MSNLDKVPAQHQDLWRTYVETSSDVNLNELVKLYTPLVYKLARRFDDECNNPDYISHGLMALVDAIKAFGKARHIYFINWASLYVWRRMLNIYRGVRHQRKIKFHSCDFSRLEVHSPDMDVSDALSKIFEGYEEYYEAFLERFGHDQDLNKVWQSTPHVSYKALSVAMPKVMKNLKRRAERYCR